MKPIEQNLMQEELNDATDELEKKAICRKYGAMNTELIDKLEDYDPTYVEKQ